MTPFKDRAFVMAVLLALTLASSARSDAYQVPLDGSDKNVNPADFGYRIEVSDADFLARIKLVLTAPAAKSFGSGYLELRKNGETALVTMVGLQRRGGNEGGTIELKFDLRLLDDGELTLYTAPMEGQPLTKNFGGFRMSLKKLLETAANK
jgi:hypothetical protein